MRPFWQPQSALFFPDPPIPVSFSLLKTFLRPNRSLELLYFGDCMWPALRNGARLTVTGCVVSAGNHIETGRVVLCAPNGIPDILRIVGSKLDGDGHLQFEVSGDSNPAQPATITSGQILGLLSSNRSLKGMSLSPGWSRSFRRLVLDLLEAIGGGPDVLDESASDGIGPGTLSDSIRRKYDEQAPFYRDTMIKSPIAIALPLLDEIHREVPPGRRILVAGSGAGRECFALSGEGWDLAGVDFSSSMVRLASEEAACRGLSARFQCSDLRVHEEPPRSLAAVLFTYDVYSFIPDSSDRVELLLKMRRWLEPGGVIFLSARRIHSNFERFILALQWFAAAFPDRKPSRSSDDRYPDFGWSHTRWISPNGVFQRSFVAHFTNARLRSEFLRAGLEAGSWRAGHCVLRPIR